MTQTEGSGGAGLLQFLRDRKSLRVPSSSSFSPSATEPAPVPFDSALESQTADDLLVRLAPILPKVRDVRQSLPLYLNYAQSLVDEYYVSLLE